MRRLARQLLFGAPHAGEPFFLCRFGISHVAKALELNVFFNPSLMRRYEPVYFALRASFRRSDENLGLIRDFERQGPAA